MEILAKEKGLCGVTRFFTKIKKEILKSWFSVACPFELGLNKNTFHLVNFSLIENRSQLLRNGYQGYFLACFVYILHIHEIEIGSTTPPFIFNGVKKIWIYYLFHKMFVALSWFLYVLNAYEMLQHSLLR